MIKNRFRRKCRFGNCRQYFLIDAKWNYRNQVSFCRKHYLQHNGKPTLKERILKEMVIKDKSV